MSMQKSQWVQIHFQVPAEQLWKSVITVSNAGKKRGRGRGASRRMVKNLNKGQIIGKGRINMAWPGLTTPILQGSTLMEQQRLPDDTTREERILKAQEISLRRTKREKLSRLEQGWTSASMGGRKVGPPDPIKDQTFEGFESVILEGKIVCCMDAKMGRKRRYSVFLVTGNRNGLIGMSIKNNTDVRSAIKNAKNRAGQKLIYIERYENRTIFHDFYFRFGNTKIFVQKKAEGYGLVCHRAIKACCELIGITDMHAKVEGSTNVKSVINCFLMGLLQQKTHQQLAEEKKLHLVEFKKENDYLPKVVASPSTVRTEEDIDPDEVLDFTQHVLGGKIVLKRKKYAPFYTKLYSYNRHLRHMERRRGQEDVRLRMYVKHGLLKSFLTDQYPDEAIPKFWSKAKRDAAREQAEE